MSIYESYLHQNCTIIRRAAPDAWGARAEEQRSEAACRLVEEDREVKSADGTLLQSRAQLWLADTPIAPGDEVITETGQTYHTLLASEVRDLAGKIVARVAELG